jgi:hypothetical protein
MSERKILPLDKIKELREQSVLDNREMRTLIKEYGISLWYLKTGEGQPYLDLGPLYKKEKKVRISRYRL